LRIGTRIWRSTERSWAEPAGEMKVTFTSGLDKDRDGKVFEIEETTIEKYRKKEKERREARKAKMKAERGRYYHR
jgi:hypothetical protein